MCLGPDEQVQGFRDGTAHRERLSTPRRIDALQCAQASRTMQEGFLGPQLDGNTVQDRQATVGEKSEQARRMVCLTNAQVTMPRNLQQYGYEGKVSLDRKVSLLLRLLLSSSTRSLSTEARVNDHAPLFIKAS